MTILKGLNTLGYPRLHSVSLDITTQCNLQCPHCYLPKQARNIQPSYLDVDRFAHFVPTLAKLGCRYISLVGGEPLLHHDISSIIRLCKQAGLEITIYTNGTRLDEEAVRLFRTYPITVLIISFYAATDDEYQRLSVGNEEHLFSAIRSSIALLKTLHIPYRLQVFCFRDNAYIYEDLRRVLREESGIAQGWTVIPRSRDENDNQECMISVEAMADKFHSRRQQKMTEPLIQFLYEKKAACGCTAGLSRVHITTDFKIKPCIFVQDDAMTFSLDEHSFEEIFFEKMPLTIIREMPSSSLCYSCALRQSCFRCSAFGYGTEWASSGNRVMCRIARIVEQKRLQCSPNV